MEANQTSTTKAIWEKTTQGMNSLRQRGNTFAAKVSGPISKKVVPWCRDHLLSIGVLLVFPLAIAVYYWGSPEPKTVTPPKYLMLDEIPEKPSDLPLQNGEAPVVGVVPDYSPASTPPELFPFEQQQPTAELAFPQPMPLGVVQELPPPNAGSLAPWNPQEATSAQPAVSATGCVWLTGTIEDLNVTPDLIQNASRFHELTVPSRN